MKWRWVERRVLLLLHDESLAEHGGAAGILDERLLDLALARPVQRVAYGQPDFAELASVYGVGLIRNHPFVDGNKRTAFLAVGLFLYLNGFRLQTDQADATLTVLALAAGDIDENEFAEWIRSHAVARNS